MTPRPSPSLSISKISKPPPRRVDDRRARHRCHNATTPLPTEVGTHGKDDQPLKTTKETIATEDLTRLNRVALKLEYATVGWNVGEAVLTIGLGAAASSLALIGFGTVSIVEVFASGVVVWHLLPGHAVSSPARTARAHRLVAVAFAALTAALTFASLRDLLTGRRPDESPWGIAYLAITALVMFGLAVWKRRIATRLDSSPLRSEASMTFLDGVLSTSTMLGLLLNAVVGWWWADPAAALIVGIAAAREAVENWHEANELHRPN